MLMAFTGNVIFGFSFLFSKLAMDVAQPLVLLSVRFLVAFLLMTMMILMGMVKCDLKGKSILPLLILGFLQPIVYFICESYGIKYSSTSFGGIIIAMSPIIGLILGIWFLKELPTRLQILFSVLSVSGVVIMTAADGVGGFEWRGLLFLIGAAFAAAIFNIYSRRISDQFTAFERTYVMFGLGTVVFGLMALFAVGNDMGQWSAALSSKRFWISILYLSSLSSIGAFMLINKALDVLEAARALVFANVSTVISVLAGVLLLHEHFSAVQAVGIVMVLVGVYGVNAYAKRSE